MFDVASKRFIVLFVIYAIESSPAGSTINYLHSKDFTVETMLERNYPVSLRTGSPSALKPVFRPQYLSCFSNNNAINAIIEIIAIWEYVIKEATYIYSHMYSQLVIPVNTGLIQTYRKHKESFAVYDKVAKVWLIESSEQIYNYCFNGQEFEDFKAAKNKITGNRFLLVGKYTALMQEPNLLRAAASAPLMFDRFVMPRIKLVVGVPGCGKTTYITKNHSAGNLVLTSCTEGAADIRSGMSALKGFVPCTFRDSYRTIDSYLLNSRAKYSHVWVDEALMEHPGKLFLVCLFSQCTNMSMLGDPNQLGYINRLNGIKLLYDKSSMFFKPTETLNTSRRCPVDVIAIISNKYDGGAYSTSNVLRSLKCETFKSLKDVPKAANTKYLVFKQAEKKQMKEAGYDVSTIHEFQGKEAVHVVIVRTSCNAHDPLYKSAPHILVGLTRHTKPLIYYTPVTDELKRLMETPITDQEPESHRKTLSFYDSWIMVVIIWIRIIMHYIRPDSTIPTSQPTQQLHTSRYIAVQTSSPRKSRSSTWWGRVAQRVGQCNIL